VQDRVLPDDEGGPFTTVFAAAKAASDARSAVWDYSEEGEMHRETLPLLKRQVRCVLAESSGHWGSW